MSSVPSHPGLVMIGVLAALLMVPSAAWAAPGAQGTFDLTAAPIGNASAALRWTALPAAASYTVYGARTMQIDPALADRAGPESQPTSHPLARADVGAWTELGKDLRDTSATLTDLPREGTYAFVVRAVDASGREYAQSAAMTVALADAPGEDLVVDMSGFGFGGSARLTWEAVPGAARYAVLSAPPGRALSPDNQRQALTSNSTVIDGLPPGSAMRFAVVAQDSSGRVLAQTRTQEVYAAPPMGPGGPMGPQMGPIGPGVPMGPPMGPMFGLR